MGNPSERVITSINPLDLFRNHLTLDAFELVSRAFAIAGVNRRPLDSGDLLQTLLDESEMVGRLISNHGVSPSALSQSLQKMRESERHPDSVARNSKNFSMQIQRILRHSDEPLTPLDLLGRLLEEDCLAASTLAAMGVDTKQLLSQRNIRG
ncbi:MAG: hypothetical protein HYZ02_02930 [Candidatus Levybacteria bacterium]|nr:hypothetical protein [Candidatus Levybacteria bacterium]